MRTRILPLLLASVFGCAPALTVTRLNSSERKPNNVWVFFTVERGEEPVGGLDVKSFTIYEDDQLVSPYESLQVIQNPDVAAVQYTMLLLDMSGSITASGDADALVDAAKLFTERVGKSQRVGVYSFDGSPDLTPVAAFTEAQGRVDGALESLRSRTPKDPSTNLHGAVVQALKELRQALDKDERPLKFGTLVVFTDGTDRAARVSRQEMLQEISREEYRNYELFAIGVGAEINERELRQVGRDGTELASDRGKVQQAFATIADQIEAHMKRFYLLSYCTPARRGAHRVRIEAHHPEGATGNLEYDFQADGFGPPPTCDPQRAPSFRLDDVGVAPLQGGHRPEQRRVRVQPTPPGGKLSGHVKVVAADTH